MHSLLQNAVLGELASLQVVRKCAIPGFIALVLQSCSSVDIPIRGMMLSASTHIIKAYTGTVFVKYSIFVKP